MGTSHVDSNMVGKNSVETISGFASVTASAVTATVLTSLANVAGGTSIAAGTTVTAGTSVAAGTTVTAGTNIVATTYIKVGSKYVFGGAVTENSASVMAAATVYIATTLLPGSLYLNTTNTWRFNTALTATIVTTA